VVEGEAVDRADPREAGASVTVVPLDERLPPGSDVGDAVARSPGTTVRRLGGLGSFAAVSVRGSDLRQVQVHLDGLPLNPDGSAAVDLAALPLQALGRVEVWRGAAPPELAASPIGGAVNLRTRTEPVPLTMTLVAGSWTTLRAGLRGSATLGGVQVLGGASAWTSQADFVAFDDNNTPYNRIDDRLRRREGNARRQASGLIRLRGSRDPRWSVLAAATLRDEGLPGPIGGSPQGRLGTGWALLGGRWAGGPLSSLSTWAQLRDTRMQPPSGSPSRQRQGQVGLLGTTGAAVHPQLRLGLTGQARLDLQGVPGTGELPLRVAGVGLAHARWSPRPDLVLEPVVHTQLWTDRGFPDDAPEQATRLALNPRLTVRLDASDTVVLHAAGGRAVRPPDFLELFGDRGVVVGNSALRPERSLWADAGVRVLGERTTLELSAFAQDTVDRIVFVQNSASTLVPVNTEPSLSAGLELGAETTWREHADARLNLTWTETRVHGGGTTQGKRLPRIPRLAGHLDLGVRPVAEIRLGADLDVVSGNPWDIANLVVAPARILGGASIRYTPGGRAPSLHLAVRNITNTLAQPGPADPRYPDGPRVLRPITDFAGYPLPGRTLLIGLTWTPRAPRSSTP